MKLRITIVIGVFAFSGLLLAEKPEIEALKVIANRKGLARLHVDSISGKWSSFNSSYISTIVRRLAGENRFDIIEPLEHLTEQVEKASPDYHLVRRAYTSLSSLYSYYKLNPSNEIAKQAQFISRFSAILIRFKNLLVAMESALPVRSRYKNIHWFNESAHDLMAHDHDLGLKYLDMKPSHLSALNATLVEDGNDQTSIERAMVFYPTKEKKTLFRSSASEASAKKFAIFVVHGTFSAKSPDYVSDQSLLLQQTKYMAQSLSNDQNVPVEVFVFGWSGSNDNEARIDAGQELAHFVRSYFPEEEYYDIFVGHSHGGNVVFQMAHTLRNDHTPYMIVTLATPIRKDFITDNINYLFSFYSSSDWVQIAGSYEMTLRNTSETEKFTQNPRFLTRDDIKQLGLFDHNERYHTAKIYAARVLVNLESLAGPIASHTDIKYMIGALPKVIDQALQIEPNKTYVLNIALPDKNSLTVKEIERIGVQFAEVFS